VLRFPLRDRGETVAEAKRAPGGRGHPRLGFVEVWEANAPRRRPDRSDARRRGASAVGGHSLNLLN